MTEVLKILGILAICGSKFLYGPPAALLAGYGFWETICFSIGGGLAGVTFFYFLGEAVFNLWDRVFYRNKPPRKRFTKANRWIAKTKARFGLIGLAVITPCIISIPIGCLIASRYFPQPRLVLPLFYLSVVVWGFVLTGAYYGLSSFGDI